MMGLKLETMCVVLDSGNSEQLAIFYEKLLGWKRYGSSQDEWIVVVTGKADGRPELVFQQVENYIPPVWPDTADKQRQMMHLDFHVDDLKESIEHAISCGARFSPIQLEDSFCVMLDPAGHPFCLLPRKYPSGFPAS